METIGVFNDKTNQHQGFLLEDDDDDPLVEGDEALNLSKKLQDRRMKAKTRRRRRSSARFLNLGTEDDAKEPISSANLGEVYQNAIRMNAENKINAANSWNLNLIDHLDQFVSTSSSNDREEDAGVSSIRNNLQQLSLESDDAVVNFTKASCTLDASVKIYSYRVDDVHLTSYKVLANLNRTETGKSKNNDDSATKTKNVRNEEASTTSERRKVSETETLEQNLANINIAKLDEAFDIDPLFHKMSKTFDEGGAKGLLLANLGVSNKGCNIVFDSTLEDQHEMDCPKDKEDDCTTEAETVDITSLNQKLEASLEGQPLFLMQLVPQLASLREEYSELKQGGFVDKLLPSSLRYAAPKEDEIEADKSIHLEAMERSRASQAGRSLLPKENDADASSIMDDGNANFVDFGAGNDFGGDDDNFLADSTFHDGNHRYSSSSFQASFEASQEPSQAVVLLDAIANGDISGSKSNYEYFNSQAISQIQGNMWAGAAHWKKQAKKSGKVPSKNKGKKGKPASSKSRKKINICDIIDLRSPVEDLEDLMRKPPKGKKGVDPLQITKVTITKYTKNNNLLPIDLGLTVHDFDSFFLRPNDKISSYRAQQMASTLGKQVAFAQGGDDDEASFGGDIDGPGFDFGGDDDDHEDAGDFIVPALEGVRKIEKIQVGYATKAKKVDVKRLKKDLWVELELAFVDKKKAENDSVETMEEHEKEDEDYEEHNEKAEQQSETPKGSLSFQSTVKEMQSTQTQSDATLPFFFICVLHLANEKGLALESTGLKDFIIHSS
ncbi:MAG: hypothetical protein SGBAC_007692 [Bacillariaceae sp.]